ncbi:hypothetical protein BS78_04G092800 [Paspalum vaginatum]|nr:hypothetical protein BS78_04G092800 [Paspalum vaginatum]
MGYNCERRGPDAPLFTAGVSAALLGRNRGARVAAAPLRALRVAFDEFGFRGGHAAKTAVDGWLSYAGYHAGDELRIDLRLDTEPVCKRRYALRPRGPDAGDDGDEQPQEQEPSDVEEGEDMESTDDMDAMDAEPSDVKEGDEDEEGSQAEGKPMYVAPRSLLSCAVLRTLRLGSCCLDLPSAIALPSLDTLHLTQVSGRSGAIQRLVSACPRLADLTLEACGTLTGLSVVDAHLHRLALRCCHDLVAVAVAVASSELRAFEYRGAVPGPSFLTLHGPRKISFCSLDFCGEELAGPPELGSLVYFLRLFVGVERLHLTSARLGCGVGHGIFSSALKFPSFPTLLNLELTGMLPDDDTTVVTAVTRILRRTPSLETMSLFFLPEPHPKQNPWENEVTEEGLHAAHKLRYNQHAWLAVPGGAEIPCLRERMKEINLVHYQGAVAQRALAKFLLCNAPVVDRMCCEFARGPLLIQTKLMAEIKGWVMNKSAHMAFF